MSSSAAAFTFSPTGPSTNPPRPLYPAIEPYESGFIEVGKATKHSVYYEVCGNPAGKPAIFLHGGPGSGCTSANRQVFDPAAYKIVLFDQRGSGRSTPFACLEENTVWDLVADIEAVREKVGVDKWLVFGGSWGSTLALAYAETHPSRVTELVLRGIFTLRSEELRWFYQEGAHMIFPDAWAPYRDAIPEAERGDFIAAYNRRLTSEDEGTKMAAAKAWSVWEGTTSKLFPDPSFISKYEADKFSLAFARIENHYFTHWTSWMGADGDAKLLKDVSKIKHIPCVIVQGRYDLVCPMKTAWDLHSLWPEAELQVVGDAGHSALEPGIQTALIAATDRFRG